MSDFNLNGFSCPLPKLDYRTVQLAHGSGGKLSAELIEKVFLPCFGNDTLNKLEDQAVFAWDGGRIAFTTDSFVVSPIFFPGGNIGELAINGTVNDLAMSGARPLYLSVGFIIEEGLSIEQLHEIAQSMRRAADVAGVMIITGDTKVVNRGSCDQIFINTSGIGQVPTGLDLGLHRIQPGDAVLISGTMADHGMAVMTSRAGLSFQSQVRSDTAALNHLVSDMLASGGQLKAMRDPTRGGVATTLNEWAKSAKVGIKLEEQNLPVNAGTRGACEILGIDPLYVANEGKLLAVVETADAEKILAAMQKNALGREARQIGFITDQHKGMVTLKNIYGVERVIDLPVGEQLPRIC